MYTIYHIPYTDRHSRESRVYAQTKKKQFLFCFVLFYNENQNKNNKTKKCMRKQKFFSAAFRREDVTTLVFINLINFDYA